MTPLIPQQQHTQTQHHSPSPITFIPHAFPIVEIAVLLAALAILLWREHVRFVKACTCQKERGTFLRPNWKKYDRKDRE